MGRAPRMRCDLSITVFLSAPESYEGGELVVQTRAGELTFKLPAGAALVYPADSLHRVEPVRSGSRLVVVTWAQSQIRDAEVREMLHDLKRAIDHVEAREPGSETLLRLVRTHTNLTRKFAETDGG